MRFFILTVNQFRKVALALDLPNLNNDDVVADAIGKGLVEPDANVTVQEVDRIIAHPQPEDLFEHEFIGKVMGVSSDLMLVRDQEDDVFAVFPHQVEVDLD